MTWTVWAAIVIVILTVAALIKRYETRLDSVRPPAFLMTCLSLDPMQGLNAFAKSMNNSGLIMAICSRWALLLSFK